MLEFYKNPYKENEYYAMEESGKIFILNSDNLAWTDVTGTVEFNPEWYVISEDSLPRYRLDLYISVFGNDYVKKMYNEGIVKFYEKNDKVYLISNNEVFYECKDNSIKKIAPINNLISKNNLISSDEVMDIIEYSASVNLERMSLLKTPEGNIIGTDIDGQIYFLDINTGEMSTLADISNIDLKSCIPCDFSYIEKLDNNIPLVLATSKELLEEKKDFDEYFKKSITLLNKECTAGSGFDYNKEKINFCINDFGCVFAYTDYQDFICLPDRIEVLDDSTLFDEPYYDIDRLEVLNSIKNYYSKKDQKNKKIDIYDLTWYKHPYLIDEIVGRDENGKYYSIDKSDGHIFYIESSENFKKDWINICRRDAIKIQADYIFSPNLRNYIDSCRMYKNNTIINTSGKNFKFYYVALDRIIAIDEKDNWYECYIDRMEPLKQKLDKKDLSSLRSCDVLPELELVTYRRDIRNELLKLKKESIRFEDIYAYISPNGVIGGVSKSNENEEYILSYATGFLQKVKKGEGYDRRWEKCNSEQFYEISKKIQEKLKKLEEKESQYDPDWDLFKPFREVRIESLDLYYSKNNIIYGINSKKELYILEETSGIFEEPYIKFETSSKDKHCKIYKAYNVKTEIINSKSIEESDEVPVREVPIKLENLKLFIAPPNILFEPRVVGIDKHGRYFEISQYSGKVVPIEGGCPIKEDWAECSLYKAKKVQQYFTFSLELQEYIKHSAEKAFREKNQVFGKDFKFYLSDIDYVYAIDENGTEYGCNNNFMYVLENGLFIDPMWGGISQRDVMGYIKNQ